jgi:hypothetical protein
VIIRVIIVCWMIIGWFIGGVGVGGRISWIRLQLML